MLGKYSIGSSSAQCSLPSLFPLSSLLDTPLSVASLSGCLNLHEMYPRRELELTTEHGGNEASLSTGIGEVMLR